MFVTEVAMSNVAALLHSLDMFNLTQNPLRNTTAETKDNESRTDVYKGQWLPLFKTQHMHVHAQTETFRYL